MVKLMNTDLLRRHNIWVDDVKNLKSLVGQMEAKGYQNLESFKIHWDHQLYKVLEIQYIMGLTDINHKLPDVNIDIIFRSLDCCLIP